MSTITSSFRVAIILSFIVIFLLSWSPKVESSPSPRRRGGGGGSSYGGGRSSYGGGRSSYSSGSYSRGWGSKSSSSSGSYGSKVSGGYKSKGSKKSFLKKHWKKAAAFGAGAYVGHKVSKKVGKLFKPSVFYYGNYDYDHPYTFNDWDRNARLDGWVCRSDRDCEWIDPFLGCDDREFQLSRVQGDWPWRAELKGRCTCENGFYFDHDTGSCTGGMAGWLVGIIVVAVLIGVFCCCFCVCMFCKD